MLVLAAAEAAYVASYLGRLRTWDPRAAVRLQVRGGVLGLYAAPRAGVLTLVVVPLAEPVTGTALDGVDEVLSAGRLRDVLGTVTGEHAHELRLPDAVVGSAELSRLPPRGGWTPGVVGVAGDVPEAAGDEGWGGVPPAALEVARQVGLLRRVDARIRTSTTTGEGGWSRLEAPGGQVFARSGSPNLLAPSG